jgi:hypothetical protein
VPDAHANFATSLVATAPSPASSGPSLVVSSGEGTRFPAVPFNAVVCPADALATPANAEIVRVTGISTDTFTITRTQESSSARTVVVGDRIYAGITKKTLTDIETVDAAAGTGSLRTLGTGATQAMQGSLAAPLASPTFTGTPAAPTPANSDGSTKVATTAYADVQSILGGQGIPPTGVTYQNWNRTFISGSAAAATAGTLRVYAIWLPAGFTVATISLFAGATGLTTSGTGPHAWFALLNSSFSVLRQSTDVTNLSWSLNTMKTLTLSSTFVTTYTGLHYCGCMIHAGSTGTMPTVAGFTPGSGGLTAPYLAANSTTGEGATATSPATTPSSALGSLGWCGVG